MPMAAGHHALDEADYEPHLFARESQKRGGGDLRGQKDRLRPTISDLFAMRDRLLCQENADVGRAGKFGRLIAKCRHSPVAPKHSLAGTVFIRCLLADLGDPARMRLVSNYGTGIKLTWITLCSRYDGMAIIQSLVMSSSSSLTLSMYSKNRGTLSCQRLTPLPGSSYHFLFLF